MTSSALFLRLFLISSLLLAPVVVCGQSVSKRAQPGQSPESFVREYVAAIRSNDISQVKRLIHPKVLASRAAENREFFDVILAKELALNAKLSVDYKIVRITPIKESTMTAGIPHDLMFYPVQPDLEVQIDSETGPYKSLTLVRQIATVDRAWFLVFACPTARGVEVFRKQRADRDQREAHARELVKRLDLTFLSELKGLLKEHKRLDAIREYRTKSGEDLTTATEVMELISQQ